MTIKRIGKISSPEPKKPSTDRAKFGTIWVEVDHYVKAKPPGMRYCYCQVLRMDLGEDGEVDEITLGVAAMLNGEAHPKQGMYRTVRPDVIKPLRKQPTRFKVDGRVVLSFAGSR